ncbi:MAG: ATP-binding cassette domain-containing protein [Oscillospiraceae bacterium]
MNTAISVKNVYKKYGTNEVLKDINIDIKKGEFVCLLGPSGCGKSTLLRIIAGLDMQTSGQVYLSGKDATNLSAAKRNFGIVFQSYALFPNLSAFENVAYGLRNKKIDAKSLNERVDYLFDMIHLSDAKSRFPSQLSGGEQQRVALARALAVNPDFLLLDEPLSALDAKVRIKLRRQICEIQRELGLTTIMVTHDQDEALTMADRIVVMNKAQIMQSGTPEEIYEQPKSRFVADFIGSINFMDKMIEGTTVAIRPENIRISTVYEPEALHAKLTDIEFRGAFCRLSARVTHINDNREMMIDMPYSEFYKLSLSDRKEVYINLPKEKLLHFAV